MLHFLAFKPVQVAVWMVLLYIAFIIPSVIVHETVPPAPSNLEQPYNGINVTEAWLDLLTLTSQYHPFPSRRNEELREWLLTRIYSILDRNAVTWTNSSAGGVLPTDPSSDSGGEDIQARAGAFNTPINRQDALHSLSTGPAATVFSDTISNVTMATERVLNASWADSRPQALGLYFEGTNIFVYIRGTNDNNGEWWDNGGPSSTGVVVNAHFDSVATGYGASDDGIGVVTILQLISYFTTAGQQPSRGIVAMINDGEEDNLWGSRAFGYSPLLPFADSFLNLEGAGAGSQAMLFRTTDQEVTRAYSKTPHPFGSVVSSDGFRLHLIKSDTDFTVFNTVYGMRGLDMAFYRPRARYHSNQDDASHTSIPSLWHMLDSALHTVQALSSEPGYQGNGTTGVWFDTFAKSFAVMSLTGLFGWGVAMLVVTPITLIVITLLLVRSQKYYFFSGRFRTRTSRPRSSINGWNGLFRFPIALITAILTVIIVSFIVIKRNAFIVYSNEYTVWVMCISIFIFTFWAISRRASLSRPTALHRGFAIIQLYGISWILLVIDSYLMNKQKISAGFFIVIFHTLMFGAALVTLCELFTLPRKSDAISKLMVAEAEELVPATSRDSLQIDPQVDAGASTEGFASFGLSNRAAVTKDPKQLNLATVAYHLKRLPKHEITYWTADPRSEEGWAEGLPSWTWLLQFVTIAPATVIFICSIGLLVGSAVSQTGSDGSGTTFPVIIITLFSIMLMLPITPFVHRLNWLVPTFFFLLFLGTFIFNLAAFPFNPNSRYKAFFQQAVDLDTGISTVRIGGIEQFVRPMIAALPSATGKTVVCGVTAPPRTGIVLCEYDGSAVMPDITKAITSGKQRSINGFTDWLSFNVSRTSGQNRARFQIDAANSKGCQLRFDSPISNFSIVDGVGIDSRFAPFPDGGMDQIKLWRRDWDKVWEVDVEWQDSAASSDSAQAAKLDDMYEELRRRDTPSALTGRVVCIWSDANVQGTIPSMEEIFRYAPAWSTVTKLLEGLVEGSKSFSVQ